MGKGADDLKSWIDGFIDHYVRGHGLDQRTEKAYRMDLTLFCRWMEVKTENVAEASNWQDGLEDQMDGYIDYLRIEKSLSFSTLYRKNRVLGYYLSYLAEQGLISHCRKLKPVLKTDKDKKQNEARLFQNLLSRKEADAFFAAMNREYEELGSEFRRRVCLRDMVMMELIFFHKIEISQLLQMEVSDYQQDGGNLTVRKKRGEDKVIRLYSQELIRKMELWLEERKAFRHKEEYYGRMFLSKFGKPLSMEMFIQIFDKYRRLAGIEKKLTPKDLKENSMKQYARELMVERCS